MSGTVHSDISGNVCTIQIDNPEKRNALSASVRSGLVSEIELIQDDDEIRALVLTGAGDKAFSSGADISEFSEDTSEEASWDQMIEQIRGFDYPTIAMINGDVYGGAMELIGTCDLRIAVDEARFGIPPAKIGIIYSDRGIQSLMKEIGPAYMKELLFTGKPVDAKFASDIGLLNHVVERNELEDKTYEIADQIASNAPLSLKGMKKVIRALVDKQTLTSFEKDWVEEMSNEARESLDHQEGIDAFAENREPEFEGR